MLPVIALVGVACGADHPDSLSCVTREGCSEYQADDASRNMCAQVGGTVAATGCPVDKLLGSCELPLLHARNFYYEEALVAGTSRTASVGRLATLCDSEHGRWTSR